MELNNVQWLRFQTLNDLGVNFVKVSETLGLPLQTVILWLTEYEVFSTYLEYRNVEIDLVISE